MEHFIEETVDDLMFAVLSRLVDLPFDVITTRGKDGTSEIVGAALELTNPRARLSRSESRSKIFSALGEFLWYLSKANKLDFIEYYIPRYREEAEDGVIWGGYGPRLFCLNEEINQVKNITDLLRERASSRKAVIQLFNAEDLTGDPPHKDIPCTCTLQFLVRSDRLQMITHMRSNDAYFGLPHDVFSFTMLQEIIARSLNIDIGKYIHFAGSLHLYKSYEPSAKGYLDEGYQSTKLYMPPMPLGDPWPSINAVLEAEQKIRMGEIVDVNSLGLDPYWADLIRLLQAYSVIRAYKMTKDAAAFDRLREIENSLSNNHYKMYISQRVFSHGTAQ